MNEPLVAFCVPTYNHGKYLRQCIDSIMAQRWNNFEIWVSDDCSTDDTSMVMNEYVAKYPKIHYHRNAVNLGMNRNVSSLLQMPSAPYIARLDADDFISKDHLPVLMELLLKYPKAGYTHSAAFTVAGDDSIGPVRKLWRFTSYHSSEKSLKSLVHGLKMCANMPIYRRDALESIDFMAGDCYTVEDYFTACRIAQAGWGNAYSGRPLGYYRIGLNSQWTISRNISAAKGLCVVYDTLEAAYTERGWSTHAIFQIRRALAPQIARGIFGRRGITRDQEAAAEEALHRLWSGISDYKTYIERNPPGWNDWKNRKIMDLKKLVKAKLLP